MSKRLFAAVAIAALLAMPHTVRADGPVVLDDAQLDGLTAGFSLGGVSGILAFATALAGGTAPQTTGDTETKAHTEAHPFVAVGYATGKARAEGSEPGFADSTSFAVGLCVFSQCYNIGRTFNFGFGPYVAETSAGTSAP